MRDGSGASVSRIAPTRFQRLSRPAVEAGVVMVQRAAADPMPPRRGLLGLSASGSSRRLSGDLLERLVLRREDLGVLRETHDAKRLVDRRSQAAEREHALAVHDLLEHLDQDRDADRVHDPGLLEVEHERAHALVEVRIRLPGDLLAALVVDVAVRPENGDVAAALRRHLAGLAHLYFLMTIRVPHSPEVMSTSSIRLLMIWRPHPRLR